MINRRFRDGEESNNRVREGFDLGERSIRREKISAIERE